MGESEADTCPTFLSHHGTCCTGQGPVLSHGGVPHQQQALAGGARQLRLRRYLGLRQADELVFPRTITGYGVGGEEASLRFGSCPPIPAGVNRAVPGLSAYGVTCRTRNSLEDSRKYSLALYAIEGDWFATPPRMPRACGKG